MARMCHKMIIFLRKIEWFHINLDDAVKHKLFPKVGDPPHPWLQKFLMAIKSNDRDRVMDIINADRYIVYHSDCAGMTGLHWAALRENDTLVELLLKSNADPMQYDVLGHTPLYFAVKTGNNRLVKRLLIARALPVDEFYDMSEVAENYLTKVLLKKAKFILATLKMLKPEKRYKQWSPNMKLWLDMLPI